MFNDTQQHYQPTATLTPTATTAKLFMEANHWNLDPFDHHLQSPSTPPTRQRKKLLEKNREAAYRCRQKKKKWIHSLEEQSQIAETKNRELQSIVAHLREESIYLRNLLLTHGDCDCDVVQAYLRRTSEQLSSRMPTNAISSSSSSGSSESSLSSSQQRQTPFSFE